VATGCGVVTLTAARRLPGGTRTPAAWQSPRQLAGILPARRPLPPLQNMVRGKPIRRTLSNPVDRLGQVIHICLTMKTATVRDLRNRFPRVAAWIAEGEPVEITKAGKLFARLVPPAKAPKLVKPDIMAQLKATWGDRIFSSKEVAEMRAAELDGEEG
jgi:antitoxin (DNA-binding transcriptional repressor) of toxin-antitoxin stability system